MKKYIIYCALGLLAYAPFHAAISTWAISMFGHEVLFKGLKDGLLFALLALSLGVYLPQARKLLRSRIGMAAALYVVVVLIMTLASSEDFNARVVGVITLLRPIAALVIGYLVLPQATPKVRRIFVIAGLGVTIFGFLQSTILPKDILTHIGYSKNTIPPYFTIDNNQGLVRIISTMRGPNPLGAYMVIVVSMFVSFGVYLWRKAGNEKEAPFLGIALIGALTTLYSSGSRSAWLGVVVAGFVTTWLWATKKFRVLLMVGLGLVLLVGIGGLRVYKDSAFVSQNILHTDKNEWSSVNSDDARRANTRAAKQDVLKKPFGHGVGSAGIASTFGQTPRIIENQYLLVAYQLGVIGALLLLVLFVFLVSELWHKAHLYSWWEKGLVSAFLGLMLTATFVPAFDDDALGTVLFMLVGSTLGFVSHSAYANLSADERTKTKQEKISRKVRTIKTIH